MPVVGYFALQYQNYGVTYYTFCVVKCVWTKLSTLVFYEKQGYKSISYT